MKEPFELTWRHKLEIYCDGFMSDNLFATRAEIRESVSRKIREIKVREGYESEVRECRQSERDRILEALEAEGITVPSDVADRVFGDRY